MFFLTKSSSRVHFQVTFRALPPGKGGGVIDCKHPNTGFHLLTTTTVWWHRHGGTSCRAGSGCCMHLTQQGFPWSSPHWYIYPHWCPLSSLCSYILHIMQSFCWDWGHHAPTVVAIHQLVCTRALTSTHDQCSHLHLTSALLGHVSAF